MSTNELYLQPTEAIVIKVQTPLQRMIVDIFWFLYNILFNTINTIINQGDLKFNWDKKAME